MSASCTTNSEELIGLILVGGKSSRMHSAKAHLMFHQEPQWVVCDRLLSTVCTSVFFSVSPQLTPPIPVENARLIHDVFSTPIGPLGGVISAFKQFPNASLLVLACDMPELDHEAVTFLCRHRDRSKKATVFAINNSLDPLFGIYEPHILPDLLHAWTQDVLCVRKILSKLDVARVTPKHERWLTNINHAHEFKPNEAKQGVKPIHIHYYAKLRESARVSEEVIETSAHTILEVYQQAQRRHGFSYDERMMRFAKNDQMVKGSEPFAAHDTIVFIPPVSGG